MVARAGLHSNRALLSVMLMALKSVGGSGTIGTYVAIDHESILQPISHIFLRCFTILILNEYEGTYKWLQCPLLNHSHLVPALTSHAPHRWSQVTQVKESDGPFLSPH